MDELWVSFVSYFEKKWSRYIGKALYVFFWYGVNGLNNVIYQPHVWHQAIA